MFNSYLYLFFIHDATQPELSSVWVLLQHYLAALMG